MDLGQMPRPHRRRREKKLMTMDEVNEKFPLTKYKTWRATREQEGLPAAGGINAPSSRPGSVRGVEGVVPAERKESNEAARPGTPSAPAPASNAQDKTVNTESQPAQTSTSVDQGASTSQTEKPAEPANQITTEKQNTTEAPAPPAVQTPAQPPNPPAPLARVDDDDDDEDDPIRTAAAPELLATPGDTCAICIDNLEDDDDVRGLVCGHAFHAGCVDPWLTSRRACCPLCKADYYVPKPRPEGEQDQSPTGRRNGSASQPTSPQAAWVGGRSFAGMGGRSRVVLLANPRLFMEQENLHNGQNQNQNQANDGQVNNTNTNDGQARTQASNTEGQSESRSSTLANIRSRVQNFRPTVRNPFRRGGDNAESNSTPQPAAANPQPTPRQLEAGGPAQ